MSEFIVLGLIPGTQLQITFILWLVTTLALGLGSLLWLDYQKHIFRNWIVAANLFLHIRRFRLNA